MITEEKEADNQQPVFSIQPHRKNKHTFWREALLPYLGTRLVLVVVGLLASLYILPLLKSDPILPSAKVNAHFPDVLWLMWRHFDAGFYVDIALHGYWPASTLKTASDWIFHPLYPLLIFPFGHLFGGSETAFNCAAVLVSNAAALVAVTYLYLLVRQDFNAGIASRTVIHLAVFPTSFYLSAMFSSQSFWRVPWLVCITHVKGIGARRDLRRLGFAGTHTRSRAHGSSCVGMLAGAQ